MTDGHFRTLIILFAAVAVGLIGGLVFAWFISPVEYAAVEPSQLRPEYRVTYLQLVGASFAVENDWRRAQFRLDALEPDRSTVARQVADVTEQVIAEGRPAPMIRAMAKMSYRLGSYTPVMIVYLATPVPTFTPTLAPIQPGLSPTHTSFMPTPPSPTFAPPDTPTSLPTFTPTPAPLPIYLLVARDRVCEPGLSQIRVVLEDEKGKGVPGVEVWVTWENGADRFVTGLKPEKGSGYGDFDMQPGITYAIAVAESVLPLVTGLETEQCPSADPAQTIFASWQLTFRPVPPTPTPSPTAAPGIAFGPTVSEARAP